MSDFGKLNFSVSFNPTSAFPLDARCYFESLTAAQAAAATAEEAGSTNTVYYIGQKLLVVADGKATWYTIQPDKTLLADGTGNGGSGEPGQNGFSPEVSVEEITGGHRVTITDAEGTESFDVLNGEDGYTPKKGVDYLDGKDGEPGLPGEPGKDGAPGQDGKDGVTPVISIGTVETLEPGTDASASITGTAENPVLNLGIPKGMPGEGGSGGGDAIQPDWNQNDPDAADYVKNRPFYSVETPIVFAAGAYTSKPQNDLGGAFGAPIDLDPYPSQIPTTINVTLDSVEYSDLEVVFDAVFGVPMCGNRSLLNVLGTAYEDTGEPFVLAFFDVSVWLLGTDLTQVTTHTLSATIPGENHLRTYIPDRSKLPYSAAGAHAEVFNDFDKNMATGSYSHAEGDGTTASGISSHAEGSQTTAQGHHSHAEGHNTIARGSESHAEGDGTTASGISSHAEGSQTTASGEYSHAQGYMTIAASPCQHAQGKFNIEDTENKYLHITGNGKDKNNRSNANTLDWDGNAWFAGDVYIGGTGQDDPNAKKLATVEDVLAALPIYNGEVETV